LARGRADAFGFAVLPLTAHLVHAAGLLGAGFVARVAVVAARSDEVAVAALSLLH
jgi:hypothetical protein